MSKTAALLISSGNGPGECRQAVGHVLRRLSADAEDLGIEVDIVERAAKHGPSSALVVLSGEGVSGLAKAWQGVILWRCASSLRPRHRRKNWFVQVFVLPDAAGRVAIDPAEVEMQATKSGGPGGQHQNKTASAIHAKWRHPDGQVYSVCVRDGRSQYQNRKTALERLAALVAQDLEAMQGQEKSETRRLHHQLERGNPNRVFEGPDFKDAC